LLETEKKSKHTYTGKHFKQDNKDNLTASFPGQLGTWVRQYQKGKTILNLKEMMWYWDGSGISWTLCKQSAPCSRQITTPTLYHSIFTGRMLFLTPTARKH